MSRRPVQALGVVRRLYAFPRPPFLRTWLFHRSLQPLNLYRKIYPSGIQHRTFLSLSSIPTLFLPPAVFLGLFISLWTYKSLMMVLFQDKIIYMPYMPPFARSEKLSTYELSCKPVVWREERIQSLDSTKLSLAIGSIPPSHPPSDENEHLVTICYFQGNGSSIPPRLPLLSQVLKLLNASASLGQRYQILALSYRGYWTSSGRATQRGIELDAQALLRYISTTHTGTRLMLWGQSVGAGIACQAAATYLSSSSSSSSSSSQHDRPRIEILGLIMETPFTSIKAMLFAVYDSKWLPYRWLHPLLWNWWDSEEALRQIKRSGEEGGKRPPKILLLPASRDELVPSEEVDKLQRCCQRLGLDVRRRDILGAYHTEATSRRDGQMAVGEFIEEVVQRYHGPTTSPKQ